MARALKPSRHFLSPGFCAAPILGPRPAFGSRKPAYSIGSYSSLSLSSVLFPPRGPESCGHSVAGGSCTPLRVSTTRGARQSVSDPMASTGHQSAVLVFVLLSSYEPGPHPRASVILPRTSGRGYPRAG